MTIEEKYSKKILGVRNYTHEQKEFFVQDFTDLDLFEPILDEMLTGESDISPAGKQFLEEYYGLNALAELLNKRGHLKEMRLSCDSTKEIEDTLNNMVPMEAIMFIEKARGNVDSESKLRNDLLPPE